VFSIELELDIGIYEMDKNKKIIFISVTFFFNFIKKIEKCKYGGKTEQAID